MTDRSITAATALYTITIPDLFPIPQTLQGYAADDIFSTEPFQTTEFQMGVDGLLSAGFVFMAIKQNIVLQANSPSVFLFDQWYMQQITDKEVLFANGIITLVSVGGKYALRKGVLNEYTPVPDAGRVLKPRRFSIVWESVTPAKL